MATRANAERLRDARRSGSHLRVVERATLALADRDGAFVARCALEDALNTADFGECGRLIVVRRLCLPRLPAGAGPREFSAAIGIAWRGLARHAVHALEPAAAEAPAVYFEDPAEPPLAMLEVLASGSPLASAWYWANVLPDAGPEVDGRTRLAVCLERGLAGGGGRRLAERVASWPLARIEALVRGLPAAPPSLPGRPAAAGPGSRRESGGPERHPPRTAVRVPVPAFALERARAVRAMLPGDDWRADFAARCVLAAAMSAEPFDGTVAEVLPLVATGAAPAPASTPSRDERRDAPAGERPVPRRADAPSVPTPGKPAAASTRPLPEAEALRAQGPATGPLDVPRPQAGTPPPDEAGPPSARPPAGPHAFAPGPGMPWLAGARPSRHGGLTMLLNALRIAGYAGWIEAADADLARVFTRALLRRMAARLGMPRDDPHRGLLAADAAARATLRRARLPGLAPGEGDLAAGAALEAWRRQVFALLRERLGIPPGAVVRRFALVSGSATHLDVVFPLAEPDLRLRRTGLDQDPGWVPWFGRIVAFHFIDLPESADARA